MIRNHVDHSIRLQLMLAFAICLGLAFIASATSSPFFAKVNKSYSIEYDSGRQSIDNMTRSILSTLEFTTGQNATLNNETTEQAVARIIEENRWDQLKVVIVDLDGKVLYKSLNASENQVDLHGVIRNAMNNRLNDNNYRNQEYVSFYPLNIKDTRNYLIVSGMPQPSVIQYEDDSSVMPFVVGIIVFIVVFFFLTKRKMKYIEELAGGLMEISRGNLDFRIVKKSNDELGVLAESMNEMTAVLQQTIEEERMAEKTKTELITNVSHDLRTPLTLIMGYLRLLKDHNYTDEQQAGSYVNIAYSKSEKLKGLIEDLFEYTKLSNHGEKLSLKKVCLNELLEQLLEEHVTHAEANQLSFYRMLPNEKLWVDLDADKIIRVFDNLITNAVNYSFKPGQIKVAMFRDNGFVHICISNRGTPIPQAELERLFDRFYRLDESRSTESGGGSGLGLAIAKSIIDFHGGQIWAECVEEDIRFWVKLKL
ncbi:MAG: two-component system sensor histidine kinase [Paenibacillus sp.]|nr:two-component system sensor histidine kinase [Paenibacillus sp.]